MSKQLKTLIVEDNEADMEIIHRYLGKVEAFDVETTTATDYDGTMEAVDETNFDVIFMDYKLPDKSGIATISDLRSRNVGCPIIMLTGQGSERLAAISMREGADDYLTKTDLTPTSLQYSINHVLRENQKENNLKEQVKDLQRKSEIDELTGLYNRRALEARLTEEMKGAGRYDLQLSLMMLDLDNFKVINDSHGHLIGDRVLEAIGFQLLESVRETDFVARYGGDEFCVIATGSSVEETRELADRILESINKLTFDSTDETIDPSFSVGIAEYTEELDDDSDAFLHEADKAMYLAKDLGKGGIFIVRSSISNGEADPNLGDQSPPRATTS